MQEDTAGAEEQAEVERREREKRRQEKLEERERRRQARQDAKRKKVIHSRDILLLWLPLD